MRHRWLVGSCPRARRAAVPAGTVTPTEVLVVDSSAGTPFSATSELVRRIAPTLCVQDPAAVRTHGIELFTLAPELWAPVGLPGENLVPLGQVADRHEFSQLETLRIAHGLVDLLHAWAATVGHSTVVYDNVERADHTEWELLSVAVRSMPAELVELVVCSAPAGVGEPLAGELRRHALRIDVPASSDRTGGGLVTSR